MKKSIKKLNLPTDRGIWRDLQLEWLGRQNKELLDKIRRHHPEASGLECARLALEYLDSDVAEQARTSGVEQFFSRLLTRNGGGCLPRLRKRDSFSTDEEQKMDLDLRWIGLAVLCVMLVGGLFYVFGRKKRKASSEQEDTLEEKNTGPIGQATTERNSYKKPSTKTDKPQSRASVESSAPIESASTTSEKTYFVAVAYGEKLDNLPVTPDTADRWFNDGTFWWVGQPKEWEKIIEEGKLIEASNPSEIDMRARVALVFECNGVHTLKSRLLGPKTLRKLHKKENLRFQNAYVIGVSKPGTVGFSSQ